MKKDFRLTTSHLSEGAIKALHEIPITTWYGLVNALDNKADAETLIKFRNLYEGTLLVIKDFVKKHNAKKCDVSCKDYDNCKAIIVNNIEYFAEFAHEIKRITNPELPSGERLKSAGKAARKYEDFQDSIKNTLQGGFVFGG